MRLYSVMTTKNACSLHRQSLPYLFLKDQIPGVELLCDDKIPRETAAGKWDALSFHCTPTMELVARVTGWQRRGLKFVFSIDDDMPEIPEWSNAKEIWDDNRADAYWHLVRHADAVLCSTAALRDTLPVRPSGQKFCPAFVAPNLIHQLHYRPVQPQAAASARQSRGYVRVLWAGSPTHGGDLEEVVEPVTRLLDKYDKKVQFLFWGDMHPEIRRRHLFNGVFEVTSESLQNYLFRLNNEVLPDIFICPLADIKFNRSKSNLKVLEAWACGAACVASPTLPYAQTIQHGVNGLLARTTEQWVDCLSELIEDPKKRTQLIGNASVDLQEKWSWSTEACRRPWVEYYSSLCSL